MQDICYKVNSRTYLDATFFGLLFAFFDKGFCFPIVFRPPLLLLSKGTLLILLSN